VKGALENVLRECTKYNYRGAPLPITSKQVSLFEQQATRMGRGGLRGNYGVSSGWCVLLRIILSSQV